jgi:hypothetical protein
MTGRGAYATLLTNEEYLAGLFVLRKSLLSVGSVYPLVVMTVASTPQHVLDILERHGMRTRRIKELKLGSGMPAIAAHDARFLEVWAKLR